MNILYGKEQGFPPFKMETNFYGSKDMFGSWILEPKKKYKRETKLKPKMKIRNQKYNLALKLSEL
jgi:hypothetical protein